MPVEFDISISGSNGSKYLYRSNRYKSTALTPDGDVAISPKIKMESNKASSLEFIITPANECYDDIEKKKTMVYMRRDGKYIFRGRVSDVKVDIFRQKTITCESDLSFLSDSVQPPNKSTKTESVQNTKKKKRNTLYYSAMGSSHGSSKDNIKMSVRDYFSSLINEHNNQMTDAIKHFTVGTVNIDEANSVETFERTSFQDTSSVINSDLLSVYGGILQTRYTGDVVYIDWLKDYDDECDQQIRFGVNLIDLDQESPNDSEWSVLLPVGDENITIESVNNGSKYLESSSAVQKYGKIVHYHKFNNAKKPAELLAKAQKYMAVHGKVFPDSIIVKAVDLQLIDGESTPLELGEKIKVLSSPHGINKTMPCIAMELDIENPENNSYTIGVIMPPDKEKKKDTLSSKHSSSSKRSSGGIGSNRTAIEGLQEDVNVNANNINVNAENIAVNALNIAVNAENIAVVAKNIAIAADTIDLKAQEITAELEDVENNMSTKIQVTAEGITKEFNKKIYGENEDGSGGIYHDYTAKIQESAQGVTQYFEDTMWGDNGTPDNPDDDSVLGKYTADYKRTAQGEVNKFKLEMYGDGGTATNPKSGSTLYAVYTQSASEWKNVLWGEGGSQGSPKEGSVIKQTKDSIETKVSKGAIASTINQTEQSVLIKAEKINLSGYVTATTFSATNSKLTNLMAGTETATKIIATSAKVTTGTFEIGDSNNNATLKYRGTEYYALTVSMPGVTGSFNTLGNYYNSGYKTSISLAHSHSVSTGTDGTITIGGSVATDATGRSFKIADTKAYKDGVSAATAAVNVNPPVRNPDVNNGSDKYDSSTHNTTIYVKATATNGNSSSANFTVSGSNAFNAGKAAVTLNAPVRNPNVNDGEDKYDSSTHDTTIYIKTTASNGNSSSANFTVSGGSAYAAGEEKGYSDGYDLGYAAAAAGYYDQYQDGYDEGYDKGVSDGKKAGYASGKSDGYAIVKNDISVTAITVYADGHASATVRLVNPSNNQHETFSRDVNASNVRDYHT